MNAVGKCGFGAVVGILLVGAGGCRERPTPWSPMESEVTTGWLRRETAEAERWVAAAREQLVRDPSAASASLDKARASLRKLSSYYLPVLEARERAYNAYWFFQQSDTGGVTRELERVETELLNAAKSRGEPEAREIRVTLEQVTAARVALDTSPQSVSHLLESLARRLNTMLVKGELIVK